MCNNATGFRSGSNKNAATFGMATCCLARHAVAGVLHEHVLMHEALRIVMLWARVPALGPNRVKQCAAQPRVGQCATWYAGVLHGIRPVGTRDPPCTMAEAARSGLQQSTAEHSTATWWPASRVGAYKIPCTWDVVRSDLRKLWRIGACSGSNRTQ